MGDASSKIATSGEVLTRPLSKIVVPAEGSDGLFTKSWFPICLSKDVEKGKVICRDFLDGKVVIYRGEDDVARVFSAYCVHMGANLAAGGEVIGNDLRCPFHHWVYDDGGRCIKTGVGDPAPERAQLFAFPTTEICGIVFAFNGQEPLYDFPDIFGGYSEDEVLIATFEDPRCPWPVDPWSIRGNTPDWAHFACVHNMEVNIEDIPDPKSAYEWSEYWVNFDAPVTRVMPDGKVTRLVYKAQITGTTLWHNQGTMNGRWHMLLSALGIPAPGTSSHFYVAGAHLGDGSDAQERETREFVEELIGMWDTMLDEDDVILQQQHYKPGLLTNADAAVARFLTFVRDYPRAHPSREFIN